MIDEKVKAQLDRYKSRIENERLPGRCAMWLQSYRLLLNDQGKELSIDEKLDYLDPIYALGENLDPNDSLLAGQYITAVTFLRMGAICETANPETLEHLAYMIDRTGARSDDETVKFWADVALATIRRHDDETRHQADGKPRPTSLYLEEVKRLPFQPRPTG